jgi:hypothetical protein
VGLLEYYAAAFFLYWWTHRFRHADVRGHSQVGAGQESDAQHSE